jgi:ABC-type taurine transport system ATPase subunit
MTTLSRRLIGIADGQHDRIGAGRAAARRLLMDAPFAGIPAGEAFDKRRELHDTLLLVAQYSDGGSRRRECRCCRAKWRW